MRRALFVFAFAIAALARVGGACAAPADPVPPPATLAIVDFDYVDTSGEVRDQTAAHQERLRAFVAALQKDLSAGGLYRIGTLNCGAQPCSARIDPHELQKAAAAQGVRFVLTGFVHKMSTLIQWAKIDMIDAQKGDVVFDRLLTFRGDTDEAWRRAEAFVAQEIRTVAKASAAKPQGKIKLAVFEFELEDFSGGAGIIGESADDADELRRATDAARRLIEDSGRYSLVDVASADAAAVTTHRLRKCDGCDAAIARKLGADQSLVGIVTRISRTDYAVTFRLRDAHTGKLISVGQTDLRIGANYSWDRGAAWLITHKLLAQDGAR